ncbi:type II toxin-antitoxin system RelE family toxin [Pseudanabaena sp. UWO310]|uniref:type II toxin-antitoxin system RelE family toxin n=1 Tax=Pseudanabaena sp. UWO310 TaxID=2480795 RepID=UPI00115833C3|nr:type II toxin-antitoxin system RelE/ParE family toxin [Pseudanabaena sp. UWO310]TYQ29268.1 type II toxin-antitoxin system RelE/ParE family toxin [Pseudanabaena sp. UWO310]
MSYQIIIPKPVQKQLDRLPKTQRDRAIAAMRSLTNEPRPTGVKKLKGYDETYRIRFGDYRVIYKVQDKELIILLLSVSHRKDAY